MQKVQDNQRFVFFWLGLLTGAISVALIFAYESVQVSNVADAILTLYEKGKTAQLIGPSM